MWVLYLIIVIISIILSAFFSLSDMVYSVVNSLKLKKEMETNSQKRIKLAYEFSTHYEETITTILFSNNLVNILATSFATLLGYEIFKDSDFYDVSPTIMSVFLVVILLLFGEILPKVIGRAYSYKLSKIIAYPILIFKYLFFPIIYVTSKFGALLSKPFIKIENDNNKQDYISDEELHEMIETINLEGLIDEDKEELIKSAITFKDTEAHEIMTPRIDMFCLDIDENISSILFSEEIFEHTRIPVYRENRDNIIGILPTKKLLRMMLAKEKISKKTIENMLISPQYVPFSMGISEILSLMKKTKNHIVIVKDEFGSTMGLLTMEDILEELVGEIFDEMDEVEEHYKKIKKNVYEVNGDMNIDDFFDLVNLNKEDDIDITTVSGWCIDKLERFAKVGDKFKYMNLRIEILEISEFTVEKILVKVTKTKDN